MKTIYIFEIQAGHDFNLVVNERCFSDRHVGRQWAEDEIKKRDTEAREANNGEDKDFPFSFHYADRTSLLDESMSEFQR